MTETPRHDLNAELRVAALEVFAREGFAATSLQDVADRVGCTKANVLYHFGSKQGLFEASVAPVVEEFDALVSSFVPTGDAEWVEWADRMVTFMLANEHAVSIFINQVASLRDQPVITHVNRILFALDDDVVAPAAPTEAERAAMMRRQIAVAGAAYLIAQRGNVALTAARDPLDDVDFAVRVRDAVHGIVVAGGVGAPPDPQAPREPAAPILEGR
ncbi:MAG: TetR/AcrR family transcriptional regulator [Pseudoclavibacter sp.]